jgi:hypothetical protein
MTIVGRGSRAAGQENVAEGETDVDTTPDSTILMHDSHATFELK